MSRTFSRTQTYNKMSRRGFGNVRGFLGLLEPLELLEISELLSSWSSVGLLGPKFMWIDPSRRFGRARPSGADCQASYHIEPPGGFQCF